MAFSTSPGFDTRDQSIFCFGSGSGFAAPAPFLPVRWKCRRTRSASSASNELEWVFFSVTPTAVRESRIALLFTSSSRAKSLIRTLLIRPFVSNPPPLRLS
jgi:ABC-type sugar transport system permease subunit